MTGDSLRIYVLHLASRIETKVVIFSSFVNHVTLKMLELTVVGDPYVGYWQHIILKIVIGNNLNKAEYADSLW